MRMLHRFLSSLPLKSPLAMILTLLVAGPAIAGPRLEALRARGFLRCGVESSLPGFAAQDAAGQYRGFDIDLCRAVAAAVLGDAARVQFLPAGTLAQFQSEDRLDLVSRQLTWSLQREALPGIAFGPIVFYDGQAFLVSQRSSLRRSKQLAGEAVCVIGGSPAEAQLLAWFQRQQLPVRALQFDTAAEAIGAFRAGACAAYTADLSALAGLRDPESRLLPELISKEPIAPLLHDDDPQFLRVVRWTLYALIEAEELGVSARSVANDLGSRDLRVRRLLGGTPEAAAALGLGANWARQAIAAVGNYGELFERNLGAGSALQLERGLNALWTRGGLMYAPPLQ
jgi:general L-amino acid transport system substrate-binding protein